MIVVDASPLIALSKMGKLKLLKEVYGETIVGPETKAEVIEGGRTVRAPEVRLVERGAQEGWISETQLTDAEKRLAGEILKTTGLGAGESESIALGHSRNLPVVLDDKEARAVAEAMGIEYVGTAGILLEAFVKRTLDYEELEKAVRELGRVMWVSPDVIAEILKQARKVEK
ncbi:hypothetical protein MYX78_06420 [Acidobacteria bacterium AH-259-G07]|nr:hypothetical protein [Acidobacteria bacterium AH-259-G07]